ncbi:hypothetical protein NP493_2g10042 [Ridgeia piscesae]|uniref:UDP-glucuronosyltransferase n=1 Tax=Ridgeia piscesae TaxID=27915 RepID=A0AAD9ULT6_RIDPI|nr:hypothetical protein NP493_2g10042 [Ridgeia piscesae]
MTLRAISCTGYCSTVLCVTGVSLFAAAFVATTAAGQASTQTVSQSRGKILIHSVTLGKNSHLVNFVRLAKILRTDGYRVHLLVGTDGGHWDELDKTFDVVHRFPSAGKSETPAIDYRKVALEWSSMTAYEMTVSLADEMWRQCETLLRHPNILADIQRENYDLVISDFVDNCGRIVSEYLDIPTMVYSASGVQVDPAFFPDMPSFIPTYMSLYDPATFVDGAGSDGIIVVCFGTMISHLDERRTELFARVLARFPQRVVWRLTGARPASLGTNTLRVDWLPQNDLLRHASTRLFVSHCGLSSIMEAALNAVPVVAMPICTDGFQNARKLRRVGMAFMLDFKTLTEDSLENAIWEVLKDPRYKRNASRVAALLNDTLVPPREKFLYYVDYAIRHNGATHLQAGVLQTLNTWQLFNYDIAVLVFVILIVALFTTGGVHATFKHSTQ